MNELQNNQQGLQEEKKLKDQLKDFVKSSVGITLIVGSLISLSLPLLLTKFYWGIDFSNTGQIGDTIGGIAGPFLNLTGLIIVYFSFKQQLEANNKQWKSVESENKKERQQNDYDVIYKYIVVLSEDIKIHEPTFKSANQIIRQILTWDQPKGEAFPPVWELMKSVGFTWNNTEIKNIDDYWSMFKKFDQLADYLHNKFDIIVNSINDSDMDSMRKDLLFAYLRNMCVVPIYNWVPEESMQGLWNIDETNFQHQQILSLINERRVQTPMIFPHVIFPFVP